MATKIDKEACRAAYNLVRDDGSAVIWVTFKYDGSTIVPGEQGAEYQDFIRECTGRETRLRGQFLILRAIVYAGGGGAAEAKLGGAWPPRVPLALEEPDLRFLKPGWLPGLGQSHPCGERETLGQ
uniref:Coactosin-like protein n=1 Tax=Neovison vison TaxID=452646 RepID=A0A8C7APE5_NEOVI